MIVASVGSCPWWILNFWAIIRVFCIGSSPYFCWDGVEESAGSRSFSSFAQAIIGVMFMALAVAKFVLLLIKYVPVSCVVVSLSCCCGRMYGRSCSLMVGHVPVWVSCMFVMAILWLFCVIGMCLDIVVGVVLGVLSWVFSKSCTCISVNSVM